MRLYLMLRLRFYLLLCLILIISFTYTYFYFVMNRSNDIDDLILIFWPVEPRNITCRYKMADDMLPSASDPDYSPGEKAIFFHETSCRGGIDSRQACAVESAARMHPNWQINLLFISPIEELILKKSNLAKLLQFKNVKFARIHIDDYSEGTIVETVLTKKIKESTHPVEHLADILRVLTLHKFGGVALDTDVVISRSFDPLPPNWIAKEFDYNLASGAMAFAKDQVGEKVTTDILVEIRNTYAPKLWSYNGPLAIQRILNKTCPYVLRTHGNCDGLQIIRSDLFYPMYYIVNKYYFYRDPFLNRSGQPYYMHHFWNHLTKAEPVRKFSVYAELARKYCPAIFYMYNEKFGI
ncbi:lactosylceramide 4-alpha-galactosyltransferase-like isoform X2 [Anticarsia gemmatalis]|uniref:lactosylceramide 4-alpha-galactosyltransferase-like isoform X2 n=1 Tax=Anticarsia gemmatalis TaxID=129554 RepID=UPI003F76B405